jgi:hypothetical protein
MYDTFRKLEDLLLKLSEIVVEEYV